MHVHTQVLNIALVCAFYAVNGWHLCVLSFYQSSLDSIPSFPQYSHAFWGTCLNVSTYNYGLNTSLSFFISMNYFLHVWIIYLAEYVCFNGIFGNLCEFKLQIVRGSRKSLLTLFCTRDVLKCASNRNFAVRVTMCFVFFPPSCPISSKSPSHSQGSVW